MSAFGGKADIARTCADVCFLPKAEIDGLFSDPDLSQTGYF